MENYINEQHLSIFATTSCGVVMTMGFGSLATTAIMFIALVLATTGMTGILKTSVDDTTSSAITKQKFYANQMRTHISIEHSFYQDGNVTIFARNHGTAPLRIDLLSVFINNEHIRLNSTYAQIDAQTLATAEHVWEKNEILKISIPLPLDNNKQYTARINTQYDTVTLGTITT